MSKLILVVAVLTFALVWSPRLRGIIFHLHVRRFALIFVTVAILSGLGLSGYYAWKYWWPHYMSLPTVQWHDTTIQEDKNPVTPGT